jgi:hypothetical protein
MNVLFVLCANGRLSGYEIYFIETDTYQIDNYPLIDNPAPAGTTDPPCIFNLDPQFYEPLTISSELVLSELAPQPSNLWSIS